HLRRRCEVWPRLLLLIDIPACDGLIGINPPVAQEWPMGAVAVCGVQIDSSHANFFTVVWSLIENASEGITHKRTSPEFHGPVLLLAHTIDANNVDAVRHGVTTLYGLPCVELFAVGRVILRGGPSDRGGVEEDLSAHQGCDARTFRVPLIPTDQHADVGIFCFEDLISEI